MLQYSLKFWWWQILSNASFNKSTILALIASFFWFSNLHWKIAIQEMLLSLAGKCCKICNTRTLPSFAKKIRHSYFTAIEIIYNALNLLIYIVKLDLTCLFCIGELWNWFNCSPGCYILIAIYSLKIDLFYCKTGQILYLQL